MYVGPNLQIKHEGECLPIGENIRDKYCYLLILNYLNHNT